VNAGGGCVTATGIPAGDRWELVSNGTSLDCVQTTPTSSGGGSGTVNSGAAGQLGYYAATGTAVSGTANASISAGALTLGASGTVGSVTMGNATSGTVTLQTATGALGSSIATLPSGSGTLAETGLAQGWGATQGFNGGITSSDVPGASASVMRLTGAMFTGGTGATTFPYVYLNQGGTAPTTFSTAGTEYGVNAPSGFTGRMADWYINGTEVAKLSTYGNLISLPNTATSATSVTPNCEYAFVKVTASATGTFTVNAPTTCTPTDGQKLELKIISPAGGTITYAWNATYLVSATLALPTTSNAASKEDYFSFQYDADKSGWVFLASNQGF